MVIEQIYTQCLAQGAYYIESEGEAVVIDPLREVQPYIDKANKNGAKIKYVFETHFHADFVSGHIDLAKKTGANIVYGPNALPNFEVIIAKDEEIFKVGKLKIKVLHTPGHTLESTCYLLIDEQDKNIALFTGDTLFIGDVGRPDLAQNSSKGITTEMLAGLLYDSLRKKILPLEDDIIIYPAHGAGSSCGKNMSKETYDTLGNQKKNNYALRDISKEQFIHEVTDGLLPTPIYFPENVALNQNGYESLDNILLKSLRPLDVEAFEKIQEDTNVLILDTRPPKDFHQGFIPNSINIGIDGGFAPWVGTLIEDINQPLLIITEEGREEEVVTRLSRVGYDSVLGYLKGGFNSWKNAGKDFHTINRIPAKELMDKINGDNNPKMIDVRKETEFKSSHLEKSINMPLAYINKWVAEINNDEHFYLYCAGGYRSMMAASILRKNGITNFSEIDGGYSAITQNKSIHC